MSKSKTLSFVFSEKHQEYMRRSRSAAINVAEGAVRAGKTVDNVFAFAYELETTPDKLHLATGSTIANAKLNIGDCNGYGLEGIFRGRCKWGKYKDNECLQIKTPTGVKIVIFAGGGKADSFKKIRGNSYGMWIATEINLHHDNTIKEAFNRQLAAQRRKIYWDLNPDNPNAPIYAEYIDKYASMQAAGTLLGGYNYEHFTIRDNLTILKQRIEEIVSQYDQESVWYRRDILGERCVADGLVYQAFADQPDRNIICWAELNEEDRRRILASVDFVSIGVDFGGNRSLTAFVATAVLRGFSGLLVIRDHHIQGRKGDIDPNRLNSEFVGIVQRLRADLPSLYIKYCFADSEAQYLINGLRKASFEAGLGISFGDSAKKEITQRIYCTTALLNLGKLNILSDCELVINGLKSAIWDKDSAEKGKDVRLDNFSSDIDILDAFEYSWERFMKKLLPERSTA